MVYHMGQLVMSTLRPRAGSRTTSEAGGCGAAAAFAPFCCRLRRSAPRRARSFSFLGAFLLVVRLVHRRVADLRFLDELRALEGLRRGRRVLLHGLLLAHLGRLGETVSAGRWAAAPSQRLLISSSSKASYFVTFTSPPWRKKVTNLNSVRTARFAFLMASFTPGYTRSDAEILPMVVSEERCALIWPISRTPSSSWPQELRALLVLLGEVLRLLGRELLLDPQQVLQGLDVEVHLLE